MFTRQTLRAIRNTLVFMFGAIIGALIGHTEVNSLIDHRHIIIILIASGMFFLTNYLPDVLTKFRQ
jgi:hypothetical protein